MAECEKDNPMSKAKTDSVKNGITTRLLMALARLDAEFTSATCGLNDGQTEAVNELKDISFDMRQSDDRFRTVYEDCLWKKHERVINSLFNRGLIDEPVRDAELIRYKRSEN